MYVYVFYMFLVNIIGEMLFQFCLIEFYKEGKYDLDFKNPNSDSSKWVKNFIKICFAWNRVRISQIWLVLHAKYIIDSKEFL